MKKRAVFISLLLVAIGAAVSVSFVAWNDRLLLSDFSAEWLSAGIDRTTAMAAAKRTGLSAFELNHGATLKKPRSSVFLQYETIGCAICDD